ncbi:hypothetical protein N7517_010724 [Penicillium concentricum]|uniref:Uncharacterized protein n=1 Tax=Penicillium concentricum TaxID=293559 RepID=A0A9W9RAR1_9EURO|nr:uncharacterized protein N7517_010724 [Penicillium concentricum]KAJ5356115.1 hypothetical protein N7517_010724 [Penicillium concentricum]
MSQVHQQEVSDEESEEEQTQVQPPPNPTGGRKPAKLARKSAAQQEYLENYVPEPLPGRRIGPIRESRIKDRPAKVGEKDSSLKIKIELDLEVEVELYARVKGDVTIGLM